MGINIELPNVIIRGTEASAIKIQFVFALFTFPSHLYIFIHNRIICNVASFRESIQDRKSTRLNSSHVSISYAVFCLKKKNSRIELKERTEVYYIGVNVYVKFF